ncbi:hypothetical protein OF83DRAFT_1229481 [Amylostereum chailletii]|nr:hypothetical protein OF83DRAFT_1229481 [Amylostereum chailletii]
MSPTPSRPASPAPDLSSLSISPNPDPDTEPAPTEEPAREPSPPPRAPGPGEVQIRIQSNGPSAPSQITFVDPAIVQSHAKWLPTSTERRKNLNSIQIACERCQTLHRRDDLKVCSRCKTARYCSVACQKAHWKSGHKQACRPFGSGSPAALALKLAERVLAVPTLIDHITFLAIYLFDLLADPTYARADSHYLEIVCGTRHADMQAYMTRMFAGLGRDEEAQVCLAVIDVRTVHKDDPRVPARVRTAAGEARAKLAPVRATGVPIATFWFTAEGEGGREGAEADEGEGKADETEEEAKERAERARRRKEVAAINAELSFQSTLDVPHRQMRYAREHPTDTLRSSIADPQVVQRSPGMLQDNMNQLIRMDKANKLRLRAYPSANK